MSWRIKKKKDISHWLKAIFTAPRWLFSIVPPSALPTARHRRKQTKTDIEEEGKKKKIDLLSNIKNGFVYSC